MLKFKNPIILALDVDTEKEAMSLAEDLGPIAGALKVGPRLTNRFGPALVKRLSEIAPVFLDHKYYDIPSTMEGAVRSAFDMGATLTTVHASSGTVALSRLALVEKELQKIRPFRILSVTVLTSFKKEDQPPFYSVPIEKQVNELVRLSRQSGIQGFVCSPHEIRNVRSEASDALIITPGVRAQAVPDDDQTRVMGAQEAIRAGADYLVVGRPIFQAKDPLFALQTFVDDVTLG
jgi:orotidine-5'-phosphate decarboxylase